MKKRIGTFLICFVFIFMLFPITANADIGPKPSVCITFKNMGDEICYGTLLSKTAATGPSSAWNGDEAPIYNYNLDADIWKAFVNYQDSDGCYYLQNAWLCSETKRFYWTYDPPDSFKILLYYPETDTFLVSGIYESYAFDSYFTVNMAGIDISSAEAQGVILTARKSYDYTWELISLVIRIVITILIEVGIALIFGFRQKPQLTLIAKVNIVTQVILNVMLNIINYNYGFLSFLVFYVCLEICVFIVEAILYCFLLNRADKTAIPKWKSVIYKLLVVIYALVANTVSFVGGFLIAIYVPGIL